MRVILPSFAKLNLTLRVVNKRSDGYHDIVSSFLKIPSGEVIIVDFDNASLKNDVINSNIIISGENIILKALRFAREAGFKIPPLSIKLLKTIPPGSGMGAGSCNAAAILKYFGAESLAAKIGADVPFFCSVHNAAIVSGIGDKCEKLTLPRFHGVVTIPKWKSETGNAYEMLDKFLNNRYVFDIMQARKELNEIYSRINNGIYIGMLPNDFSGSLLRQHREYNELFEVFKKSGFSAWGITGSGSAAFAVSKKLEIMKTLPEFISEVLYF